MPREITALEGTRWTTTRPQTTHNAPFAGLSDCLRCDGLNRDVARGCPIIGTAPTKKSMRRMAELRRRGLLCEQHGLEGTRWTTTRPQTTHNAPFAGLGRVTYAQGTNTPIEGGCIPMPAPLKRKLSRLDRALWKHGYAYGRADQMEVLTPEESAAQGGVPLGYWNPAFAGLGGYVTQPKREALADAYSTWAAEVFDKYDRPPPGSQARLVWEQIAKALSDFQDWAFSEGLEPGAPGYDKWAQMLDAIKVKFDRYKGLMPLYVPPPEPKEPTKVVKVEEETIYGRVGPWPVAIGVAGLALALAVGRGRR